MIVVLLRVVLVLLALRFAFQFLAGVVRGLRGEAGPAATPKGVDLVRDPVCRTFVIRSAALRARVAGREQHFCSAACRDKALAAVARAS